MNHKVRDVQQLYDDARKLYTEVVQNQADGIINELNGAINILKENWKGVDAGVQINNVVDVYNGMASIRNALANLAKDSSSVASNYREIQRLNSANIDVLRPIEIDGEKQRMEAYTDTTDTIDITPEAVNGKSKLDATNDAYESFKSSVDRSYNAIMDNWQAGPGRNNAEGAFNEFMSNATKYKQTLEDVSRSITTALRNYQL